jgi:hypothetical protein
VADVIGKRRSGQAMFGGEANSSDAVENDTAPISNSSAPAKAGAQSRKRHSK